MSAAASHVYKILPRSEWIAAQDGGRFDGSAIDLKDGYIHLSTAVQAEETARLHFAGREGLVLLKIQAADLGQLFPHLYGPLDPRLVRSACPLELNAAGWPDPGPLES
jgi:uncharacterized protein (DUF952 family)